MKKLLYFEFIIIHVQCTSYRYICNECTKAKINNCGEKLLFSGNIPVLKQKIQSIIFSLFFYSLFLCKCTIKLNHPY